MTDNTGVLKFLAHTIGSSITFNDSSNIPSWIKTNSKIFIYRGTHIFPVNYSDEMIAKSEGAAGAASLLFVFFRGR